MPRRRSSSRRRGFSVSVPPHEFVRSPASPFRFSARWPSNDSVYRRRRKSFTWLVPLVHTVKDKRRPSSGRQYASLMRTVLNDRRVYPFSHPMDLPGRSPWLAIRASSRSRKTVSHIINNLGYSYLGQNVGLLPRAIECAKKAIRREVILATGRGGGDHDKPRYRSNWRC